MKKRKLLTAVTVLALCFSLCVTAFAATTMKIGQTKNGKYAIDVTAKLRVDRNSASASTTSDVQGFTFATTIIYYFINEKGQTQADSHTGTSSTGAGTTILNSGIRATSEHKANGGSTLGSWTWSLSAPAT